MGEYLLLALGGCWLISYCGCSCFVDWLVGLVWFVLYIEGREGGRELRVRVGQARTHAGSGGNEILGGEYIRHDGRGGGKERGGGGGGGLDGSEESWIDYYDL